MLSHGSQGGLGDEAQVCRAGGWTLGFRFKLLAQLVKVKLLLPKTQSLTIALEKCRRKSMRMLISVSKLLKPGGVPSPWIAIQACPLVVGLSQPTRVPFWSPCTNYHSGNFINNNNNNNENQYI